MIPRTRLIITALVVCHLLLQPRLLTSQLRPSQPQQNPAQSTTSSPPSQQQNSAPSTASPPASASPGSSAADDDDDLDDLLDDISPPPHSPRSGITAQTDTGQEDTQTEQIIQQELQSSNEQELGPQRPAMNVPLAATKC